MKKVTVYLDEELWRAFRIACLQEGVSASQQIMQWIHVYLHQPSDEQVTPPPRS